MQGELENTCKPDIQCISGSMDMRESNERAMGKNECFHTFCENFENFILCIPEHLFSFTLKLLSVDFVQ